MKHRRFHQPAHPALARARLSPRREALVYWILGLLWTSGIGWLVFHYFLRQAGEFGEMSHPLEAWWLRLHGAGAFAGLWLIGLLWAIHLVPGWKSRRRPSGIVLSGLLSVLVLSGYLLYYAGGDRMHEVVALVHWLVGLALPLPLLLHGLRGRRARGSQRGA
ncbi:hypothetical protein [Dokdonella soli]|uniref:hypothetical protein n=1 Tax=Dokdonella soli TaxID=529810 RepID=UPI0031D40B65